jgi:hypothetical protein
MFHRRLRRNVLMSAICAAVFAAPAVAQSSDRDKICSQIQNRAFTVGTWATYRWTGGQSTGSTMRMAVFGTEPHEGTTYYWYEVTIADPQRPKGKMIMQMLVPGLGQSMGHVRTVIVKSGDQPAMKMPPQMIQMINNTPGMNMSAEIARQCQEMEVVGWEQVSVPAGQFRALHLRHPRPTMVVEAWVQPDLQFAMVKGTLKDGGQMELTGQGTGAKSSITETPVEMPGFPGAPPPR